MIFEHEGMSHNMSTAEFDCLYVTNKRQERHFLLLYYLFINIIYFILFEKKCGPCLHSHFILV